MGRRKTIVEEFDENLPEEDESPQRKAPTARKTRAKQDGDLLDDGESSPIAETDDVRDFAQFDDDFADWVAKENLEKASYTASLYKYDPINRAKQWLVGMQRDELLSAHDVGMKYGSGEYRYLITFKQTDGQRPKPKAWKFNIHPIYDEHRKKLGLDNQTPTALTAGRGNTGFGEAMEMVKSVVDMIKPLLVSNQAPAQDPSIGMIQSYRMMQEVMKANLLENVKLHKEVAQEAMKGGESQGENRRYDEGDDEMDEEKSFLEQIMPFLETFLPKILGGGPQSTATVQTLKALPQFKQIMRDKQELKRLCVGLEKEIGVDKVGELLKKLKIKRPA